MSFTSSFINTIGRELGRDVYRSLASTSSSRRGLSVNEKILRDIESFSLKLN